MAGCRRRRRRRLRHLGDRISSPCWPIAPACPWPSTPGLTILSACHRHDACAASGFAAGAQPGRRRGRAAWSPAPRSRAMHYTGMAAVRHARARAVWDAGLCRWPRSLIGISGDGLAWHFVGRLQEPRRLSAVIGAGLFMLAIVGLHFTAMTAVRLCPESADVSPGAVMAPFALAVAVAASCRASSSAQALIVALVDRHLGQPRPGRGAAHARSYRRAGSHPDGL